jgi:hypothetical protein
LQTGRWRLGKRKQDQRATGGSHKSAAPKM